MRQSAVMRTPRHVDLDLTPRCNLRCGYCYREGTPSGRELSTAAWADLLRELGSCAVMSVCLAGGEPFLRADLPELLGEIVRRGLRFSILTNGTLVDERAADAVAARATRCDFVQVSLDDGAAEGHDAFRGRGSFAQAVRGARLLLARGVPVTARLTVHARNVERLLGAVAYLIEELGVAAVSTNAATALGACARSGAAIVLSARQRQRAMADLLRLEARYPGRVGAMAGPLADAHRFAAMEAARRSGAPAFEDGGRLSGCGCAGEALGVRADGVYVPCLLLPDVELGRVGVDALGAVFRESPVLAALRERCALELTSLPECAGCAYTPYCTGNCPAAVHAETGNFDAPDPGACLRRFLEEGGSVALPADEGCAPAGRP